MRSLYHFLEKIQFVQPIVHWLVSCNTAQVYFCPVAGSLCNWIPKLVSTEHTKTRLNNLDLNLDLTLTRHQLTRGASSAGGGPGLTGVQWREFSVGFKVASDWGSAGQRVRPAWTWGSTWSIRRLWTRLRTWCIRWLWRWLHNLRELRNWHSRRLWRWNIRQLWGWLAAHLA